MDSYYVVINCPNTGRGMRTGVEVSDFAAFDFVGLMPQTVMCEHCTFSHSWTNKDAWLERHAVSRVQVLPASTPWKSFSKPHR